MNNQLKYKLDTAGIIAFVVGVLLIMGICAHFFRDTFYEEEVIRNVSIEWIIAFCATLFGPITGGLIGFLGVVCASAVSSGSIAFGEAVAFGVYGIFIGQFADKYYIRESQFTVKRTILWNLVHVAGLIASFIFVKPGIDFMLYRRGLFTAIRLGTRVVYYCFVPTGIILTILFLLISRVFQNKK